MTHTREKSVNRNRPRYEMVELADRDFKRDVTYSFTNVKQNMNIIQIMR